MSDQDRGPYAPQSDAPLSFDPRQSRGGGGGPAPLTLLVSAIILMALIVGVLLFYRHGVRHQEGPATLVGAPVAQTKAAPPPADATASDAAAGLQVYKSEATPSTEGAQPAPAFEGNQEQPTPLPAARPVQAPPPIVNAPLHREQAPPPVIHHTAPKPITVAKLPPAPSAPPAPIHAAPPPPRVAVLPAEPETHTITPSAKTLALAASGDTTKPQSATKPKPKPAEAKTAEAKPAAEPKPASSAGGPVTVQIGAFSSAALAQQGWSDTAHVLPGAMAGKSRKVESTVKDGKTYYRSYVGGFASKADAEAFCTSLRGRNRPCMVK